MGDGDPHDLARFVAAQERTWETALAEIRAGRKRSHWMWFVFPQVAGLGSSPTAQRYAIQSMDEAAAFLRHPLLGARLLECAEATVSLDAGSARDVFGSPDDLKLRSSATLFALVSPPGSVFERLLEKYFEGRPDERTLHLVGRAGTLPG